MMRIKRFRALAESYGADLQRWPEQVRREARALLDSSAEAREIMARAGRLDEAMAAAGAARTERLWSGDHPDAALERLHNRVAARIGPAPAAAGEREIHAGNLPRIRRAGWLGLATAASIAVLAGIALGVLYSPTASQQDLLALLQPSPLQLPGD